MAQDDDDALDEAAPSRGDRAYQTLKAEIRSGALKPGERIRETQIAARLGLSRTPVREALHRLSADGLVDHRPRLGLVVATLGHGEMVELYQMREVFEGAAAAFAAQHASEAELATLAKLLDTERGLLDDPATQARHNQRFHRTLHLAAHNRYLLKLLGGLEDTFALLGPTTMMLAARRRAAHEEHGQVVAAVTARDAPMAEQAMRAHIRAALSARLALRVEEDHEQGGDDELAD